MSHLLQFKNMQAIMESFKIGEYGGINIDCWSRQQLVSLRHLLQQEGCLVSENKFKDDDKAIELDDVQKRISQKYHCDKKSSADILLHVLSGNREKLLLADAKFRVSNINNLDAREIDKKAKASRAIVLSDIPFCSKFYILLKSQAVSASKLNAIRRKFRNNPNMEFMDAISFHRLFEA